MQQKQLLSLLTSTLNPSLLEQSQRMIQVARTNKGFATGLMLVANDANNDIKIRQSALVILKNMVYDQCNQRGLINKEDFQIIKASILDFLARQWGIKILTNTIRSIIHLISEMDYPDNWPNILNDALHYIEASQNANDVAGAVQTLKAIASTCGKDQTSLIKVNNFCNQITTPLLRLANKLFSNYNADTQQILVSIFKIFNLVIFYHMPLVIQNNIHSIMIFIKKILDMNQTQIIPLKVICLKILSRIYSRHVRQDTQINLIKFAQNFHDRYSASFLQSFVLQLMNQNSTIQICNLSLNCLTCIYKSHQTSKNLIKNNHGNILRSCLHSFKLKKISKGQSVGTYITLVQEQRSQLIDFISTLLKENDGILGELIQILNRCGDETIQELVLYIFSALGQELEDYPLLNNSMSQFIVQYILPILSGNNSPIMKARGCEVICAYSRYVQLPSQNLQTIFQFIYSCLTQSKSSYLNIFALQAFTLLICKYDEFMKLIIPYLQDILKVYTDLMKQSNGQVMDVIKSFELFLSNLNGNDIQGYAIDLIKFLIQLFYQYSNSQGNQHQNQNQSQQQQDEQQQDNIPNAKKGCLACIRQIMACDLPQNIYPIVVNQLIFPLCIELLQDKNLDNFEQCLNILNLSIYKNNQLPKNFEQFFKIFTYSILGIPNQLGSINLSQEYKQILTNICINPDDDIVSNVVGFFRNFIGKSKNILRDYKDQIGISFIEYLFKIVQWVHNSQNQKGQYRYKSSQRFIIMTIYTSLVQFQFLNNNQFTIIVHNVMNWYSAVQNQPKNQTNPYIQILLVCLFYNCQLTSNKLNIQWFIQELILRQKLFYDQYQLQRLLIGVSKLTEKKMLTNQQTGTKIVKMIPNIVAKLISVRNKGQQTQKRQQQQHIDSQQQAVQDFIGDNTHLGTFIQNNNQQQINRQRQAQLQKQLNAMDQQQWEAEFNKYYYSPFFAFNQLEYLKNVLKDSPYSSLLTKQQQQKLTQYLCNIPQKKI